MVRALLAAMKTSLPSYNTGMTISYIRTSDIAREFRVRRQTVQYWRRSPSFPEPDVMTGDVPGWLPERMDEIKQWYANRPGQGTGGGRPRKNPATED